MDDALYQATKPWLYLLEWFPDFDFRRPKTPELLDIRKPDNIVGHWQRAVNIWWAVEALGKTGGVGLEFGAAGVRTPWCLSTDIRAGLPSLYKHHDGTRHPVWGHLRVDASFHGVSQEMADSITGETVLVFGTGVFPEESFHLILANHVLEHLPGDPAEHLQAWSRLLVPGGVIAVVVPDERWFDVLKADPDHKHAWTGQQFSKLAHSVPGLDVIEETFETQVNYHSFATVWKKR